MMMVMSVEAWVGVSMPLKMDVIGVFRKLRGQNQGTA
jgi:hypothetical protein